MDSHRSLLIPLDGSPLAELAVPVATRLALRTSAAVHLVRAHQALMAEEVPGGAEWEGWAREEERQYLDAVAERLRNAGVIRVTTDLVGAPVAEAIWDFGRKVAADLIVMATHGRTGFSRLWFGSVADAVVRRSTIPALLVRATEQVDRVSRPFGRILIPLDGSPAGERIIPHALALAVPDRAEVLFVRIAVPVHVPAPVFAFTGSGDGDSHVQAIDHAVEMAEEYVHDIVRRVVLRYPSLDVQAVVHVHPQPAAAILRVASVQDVDLVAMTTHGRGGSRLLVGSVADKVLRGTSASLLVCRA